MLISAHAKQRYAEQYDEPREFSDQDIIDHFKVSEPVTEEELLLIRKSRNPSAVMKDKGNAIHYIDRNNQLVFVVANRIDVIKRDDLTNGILLTCYRAPYLTMLNELCGDRSNTERDVVIAAIEEARTLESQMRWAVALYLLYHKDFRILLGNDERRLRISDGKTGILVQHTSQNAKVEKFKIFSDTQFYNVAWSNRFRWTFADFGIRRIADL